MNYVLVSCKINKEEEENLINNLITPIKVPLSGLLAKPLCDHVDMLLNIIDEKNILVHKDMDKDFILLLSNLDYNIHYSKNLLKANYPEDIILNGLNLNDVFIHNLKNTDKNLLSLIEKKGKIVLNTKQGYSKCSVAEVSQNAFITSDENMYRILEGFGFDVLKIPYGDISLFPYEYGFIGGCCGLVLQDVLAFYGDLSFYKYGDRVLDFLNKHGVKALYLRKGGLVDRGSIFRVGIKE